MKLTKRNIIILCCSLAMICAVTFSVRFIKYIDILVFKIVAQVVLNLLNGLIAWIAMKLAGMKVDIDLKNKHQYLVGVMIALILSVTIAIIPALCGFSLVGNHEDFSWFILIYDVLFYLLIIGPVEEFVFRVYVQDAFVSFFEKHKWLGVVIASFLFGLWHIINGNVVQVLFTFGIGLVFGFAKYKIKDCGYVGVSFGHGLYDFMNTLVRMFIV
ncbi:MAG: CPBP family intramembrane glutamic endopeptidase [Agathobacter sp.]|nr:CPBP family intramembrane glutamic endopeptidase [Agathobacter sp.]